MLVYTGQRLCQHIHSCLLQGTGQGATVRVTEEDKRGVVPTLTEFMTNMEADTNAITTFEKCNEGKEGICETIMRNVISIGGISGQVP